MPQEYIMELALKKWGESAQLDMVIEEMAELTKAILKYKRGESIDRIAEEHADVNIMLDQLSFMMLKHDPEYSEKKRNETKRKVTRLVNMLECEH